MRGAQQMNERENLCGLSILVLEDDYYIAAALKRLLTLAGATVHGPFASENDAIEHLENCIPDCALLDINLGFGPSFNTARVLKMHGIRFVFISGYDTFVVPEEFADIPLLQKPIGLSDLVRAIVPQTHCLKDIP